MVCRTVRCFSYYFEFKKLQQRKLTDEITTLSTTILRQFDLVEKLIDNRNQADVLEQIAANEEIIDTTEISAMKKIPLLIVLQSPKAGELRMLVAAHDVVMLLEHIGDLQSDFVENLKKIDLNLPDYTDFKEDLKKIFAILKTIVGTAAFSYYKGDKSLAYPVIGKMEEIDRLANEMSENLMSGFLDVPLNKQELQNVTKLNEMVYMIKKIKKFAIYIAKATIFAIEGTDIRHQRFEKYTAYGSD